MRLKVTLLGCGTSTGVPRLPDDWGACDPANPKNRRRRPSLLVESETTTIVVDTGPDFRVQMFDAGVTRLDAVLYTHEHADHIHGIDDLRGFFLNQRTPIPLYGDKGTLEALKQRFGYIFDGKLGYPVMGQGHEIGTAPFTIGDIPIHPFWQDHGPIKSLGFRFGDLAYSTDARGFPDESLAILAGSRTWIMDAVRYHPHPSHAHVDLALEWIARVAPERAVLTHMAPELDYETLQADLPPSVEPGYDGMLLDAYMD